MTKLNKTLNVLSYVFLACFILFTILLVGVRLIGIEPYIVLSGSMEPEIGTGSLIYVKRLSEDEARELKVGDTVTFATDGKGATVTHKIYEVVGTAYVRNQHGEIVNDADGNPMIAYDDFGKPLYMYTTYGINNKNESEPSGYTLDGKIGVGNLASVNIIGKPAFTIPYLGYIAHFVQNPPGKYVAILLCLFIVITTFFGSDKNEKKDEEKNDSDAKEDSKQTDDPKANKESGIPSSSVIDEELTNTAENSTQAQADEQKNIEAKPQEAENTSDIKSE